MDYSIKNFKDEGIIVEISLMDIPHKAKDYHIILHVEPLNRTFEDQWKSLATVLKNILQGSAQLNIVNSKAIPVFARCFLTDIANQKEKVLNLTSILHCEVSYIEQPLLDGSKLALWINMQTDVTAENKDKLWSFTRNGYSQYYTAERINPLFHQLNTSDQTVRLLDSYEEKLNKKNCTVNKNCLRTWFYVRDIDVNYQDFVDARRKKFQEIGLRADTHYIASTGIEGRSEFAWEKVMLDTFAMKGIEEGQVQYLYAKEYLSATDEYGVTFERGVMVDFGDRRNVYISGTASIDHKGRIIHKGNIGLQSLKMLENVKTLLHEAACSIEDVAMVIIYLRDIADYRYVRDFLKATLTNIPQLILLAPICRPKWVIEMECIASKKKSSDKFRDF